MNPMPDLRGRSWLAGRSNSHLITPPGPQPICNRCPELFPSRHAPEEFDAWSGATYSNFGFLVLGEILEAQAPGGYLGYLRNQIMSAANWIPSTEWGPARTLQANLDAREPVYQGGETGPSVFDYVPPIDNVFLQYGGYDVETMLAHGGLIASSQAILHFGSLFSVVYQTQSAGVSQSNKIGLPLSAANPMSTGAHTGSLPGSSTILQQISGGASTNYDVVIHIAFNKRSGSDDWAAQAAVQVTAFLNTLAANAWPTTTSDGFWTALGSENPTAGFGGFHSNFQGFGSALNRVADGSYLRLRAGSQAWTGTINKLVRLDAPEGPVTLGK